MTDEATTTPAVDAVEPVVESPSIFDLYETDSTAEEEGRWILNYFGDRAQGDIKLRGFSSKASIACRRRLDTLFRRHARADGTYPMDIANQMANEQLAQAIIVDWRGPAFRDKAGKAIPFSPAAALEILKKMPHLRNRIAGSAGEMDNFRVAEQAAAEKN